ncbi:MAG: hypothetical protein V4754_15630 [Pseudomonadota bacterium]
MQLPGDFKKQTDAAKENAIAAAKRGVLSKLDEHSAGADAFKASRQKLAQAKANQARARVLASMNRQQQAFVAHAGPAADDLMAFSAETLSNASDLIGQGDLSVSDQVLAPFELQAHQLANQRVEEALISEREADIEAVMDKPYRNEAMRRIKLLSNAPKSREECNDLTEKLREHAHADDMSMNTFRIYADALNILARPDITNASDDVRSEAASDPDTPPETLTRLARDPYQNVRSAVGGNLATPPETLATLARDDDWTVRAAVGANPNTPLDILATLANDPDEDVRRAVASNPNISADIATRLADSEDEHVLSALGGNRATPVAILSALAISDSATVRGAVAGNPTTLTETLHTLTNDRDEDVRMAAGGNPNTPSDDLATLARDPSWYVRSAVAGNPNTPGHVLTELGRDRKWDVRLAAHNNPSTPD